MQRQSGKSMGWAGGSFNGAAAARQVHLQLGCITAVRQCQHTFAFSRASRRDSSTDSPLRVVEEAQMRTSVWAAQDSQGMPPNESSRLAA